MFWLGVHRTNWIEKTAVPLFLSHRILRDRKRLPCPHGPIAVDSGAFTELSTHGRWTTEPQEYLDQLYRYRQAFAGHFAWAAPQDWMCEPFMLDKTGKTVAEHQALTVANFLTLRELAPDLPIIPVLQGWTLDDYHRCADLYASSGVDLPAEPLVGIGSVCRRQDTGEIEVIVESLVALGLSLHGFGVKTSGVSRYAAFLASADSMAWSYQARRSSPMPGCTHQSGANCLRYALWWRERVGAGVHVRAGPTVGDSVVTIRAEGSGV